MWSEALVKSFDLHIRCLAIQHVDLAKGRFHAGMFALITAFDMFRLS